jgi:hypothetical protein
MGVNLEVPAKNITPGSRGLYGRPVTVAWKYHSGPGGAVWAPGCACARKLDVVDMLALFSGHDIAYALHGLAATIVRRIPGRRDALVPASSGLRRSPS